MDEGLSRIFNKQQGKASLGTKIIGKKIYSYDRVTSTNDIAHFLASGGEPEGSVIFAKGQTKGRGRQGNIWISPYGEGLYFSFILRPDFRAQEASRVTLAVALAVTKSLEEVHFSNISIKWPNDILLDEKKVCGILTELSLEGERVKYIVVGLGLNVNSQKEDLPDNATSLKLSVMKSFDIADLSHIIIKHIDFYYSMVLRRQFAEITEEAKHYSGLILGGRIRVSWQDKVIEGYAVDFDEYGGLVIRRDNGLLEKIYAGHIEKIKHRKF